jgi:CRISPR system Cascade subunit CasA
MHFDLIDQPWVPVHRFGKPVLVSLREALVEAHELDELAPPRPTLVPAVLRQVLLPIVIDAFDIPTSEVDWAERWRAGQFDAPQIEGYLDRHRDRFDLFHPEQPFAQVRGLETTKGETKPSSLLIPNIAAGNNVPLFSARLETEAPQLTPAEAVLWLLHTHCWDTAAIKSGASGDPKAKQGKTTGNPTGPLGAFEVVVPIGRSLFETLLLNTPIHPDGRPGHDLPQWRDDPAGPEWQERPPRGLCDLLTWQARRIRLIPEEGPDGPCVREVIVCAGDRLIADPDLEPHAAWRRPTRPRANQPARQPQPPRAGRNAWQGLNALLALDPPEDGRSETSALLRQAGDLADLLGDTYPLRVLTTGVLYGNQRAVVEHIVADLMPLPVAALRQQEGVWERLTEIVEQTARLAWLLNGLDAELRRARGGDALPHGRGQQPEIELIQRLDPQARRLLAGLQAEPHREQHAQWAWQRTASFIVYELAERLLDAVPPSAFAGREDPDGNRVYRPANAEAFFRHQVAQTLPQRNDVPPDLSEDR